MKIIWMQPLDISYIRLKDSILMIFTVLTGIWLLEMQRMLLRLVMTGYTRT